MVRVENARSEPLQGAADQLPSQVFPLLGFLWESDAESITWLMC